MSKQSLITKISLVFAFAFLLVVVVFSLLAKFQIEKNLNLMQERQFQAINYLFMLYENNTPPKDIQGYFSNFGIKKVQNTNMQISVLKKGEVSFQRDTNLGRFTSFIYNGRYYLYVQNPSFNALLESIEKKNANDYLIIGFIISLVSLFWAYYSIIKSISPLKKLSKNIRRFASGDMNIECKSDKKDEIALVANEFDNAVKKIRALITSRQLFLRTIMHELKTPIGKGRIISEMVKSEKEKQRLIDVFERLNLLIDEFGKIEKLVSKSYELKLEEYPIDCLLENAKDLLMLDNEEKVKIEENEENLLIMADFDLMSLAIKNLLDNAIKYSDDNFVRVQINPNSLIFTNKSKPLEFSFEYYVKAFVTTHKSSTTSLGLGLYIVDSIIDLHNYKFLYEYKDNLHHFIISWGNHDKRP